MRHAVAGGLLVFLSVASLACRSRLTGDEGVLAFSYVADDRLTDFNKAIAVGARLDLRVENASDLKPVPVTEATSASPAMLAVKAIENDTVVLEGVAEGRTTLSVKATVGGAVQADSVDLRVAKAERLKLGHSCTIDAQGQYFTDQEILIPFDLERADGQPVIGYGYYPVTVVPDTALAKKADVRAVAHLWYQTAATAGDVSINSTIDATTLQVKLVTRSSIDGASFWGDQAQLTVLAGKKGYALIHPTVAGKIVCQAKAQVEVTSQTPAICAVSALQTARQDDKAGTTLGWVEIDGQASGDCVFKVRYPEANGGVGVEKSFTVHVAA